MSGLEGLEVGKAKISFLMSKPDSPERGLLRNLSAVELGKLSSLASISTALSRAKGGFLEVASTMLESLLPTLGAERLAVLVDPPLAHLSLYRQVTPNGVDPTPFQFSSTVVKRVKETGEPWQTLDAFQDEAVSMTASLVLSGARSVMCVPLHGTGLLYADNRLGPGKFEEPELALLTILADLLAAALERARSTERLNAANEELRVSREETITRLAVAADWRDTETAAHIERVGQYAASLARWAGCPRDFVEQIRLASKMHDVGKLGVPDAILRKPGKFTPEEFDEMKKHTLMGGRILEGSTSPLIQMAHRIALFHHERWDGSGYPHGIAGEAIPLEGRITAVCDVFDALCSRRVYKDAYPIDSAFAIIAEEAGKHFDPRLSRLFVENRAEVIEIKNAMGG